MKEIRQIAEITISYRPTVTRMLTIGSSNEILEHILNFKYSLETRKILSRDYINYHLFPLFCVLKE